MDGIHAAAVESISGIPLSGASAEEDSKKENMNVGNEPQTSTQPNHSLSATSLQDSNKSAALLVPNMRSKSAPPKMNRNSTGVSFNMTPDLIRLESLAFEGPEDAIERMQKESQFWHEEEERQWLYSYRSLIFTLLSVASFCPYYLLGSTRSLTFPLVISVFMVFSYFWLHFTASCNPLMPRYRGRVFHYILKNEIYDKDCRWQCLLPSSFPAIIVIGHVFLTISFYWFDSMYDNENRMRCGGEKGGRCLAIEALSFSFFTFYMFALYTSISLGWAVSPEVSEQSDARGEELISEFPVLEPLLEGEFFSFFLSSLSLALPLSSTNSPVSPSSLSLSFLSSQTVLIHSLSLTLIFSLSLSP